MTVSVGNSFAGKALEVVRWEKFSTAKDRQAGSFAGFYRR